MNSPTITPAQSLQEVYLTLRPEPLTTEAELNAFYRQEINAVRGEDKVQRLVQGLKRAHGSTYFQAFFMGHQGVGKSTELSRPIVEIAPQFRVIRFSALNNLDPSNFKPLDIVLTMMADVAEQTSRPIEQGGAGRTPSAVRLREVWEWFAAEKSTIEQATASAISIEGGGGLKEDSLWGKVLGLFANLKLRDLFLLVNYAADTADLRGAATISVSDTNESMQEFNGQRWFGVHPLVVDILAKQNLIQRPSTGGVPGGIA